MILEAYKAGANDTISPIPVIKAFETITRVGHAKLWSPPERERDVPRNVTINIVGGAPRQIEAQVIDVVAVAEKPS